MDKEKRLRRKLFIGGAYLVVALLLLIYVSYSAYRIKITATVQMPEALAQKASLYIDYNQEKGLAKDAKGLVLNDLMPGEKASDYKDKGYATASQLGRAIRFKVSNAEYIDDQTKNPGGDRSKFDMKYTLRVIETGVVPLDCILVKSGDTSGTYYNAKTTGDTYEKRDCYFKNGSNTAEFTLSSQELEEHEFTLYVGWNNNHSYDSSRRKEIASIEICADMTQGIPVATTSEATPSVDHYYTKVKPQDASPSQGSSD